jgi:short subunit dehydrogenase-like uncharacterized protein
MISSVSLNAEYVILGATGNTGSIIADSLLSKGKKVRVVGRDAERLERFVRKGAEAFIGDVSDTDLTGKICTRWNERESTRRKSGSCQSKGTSQSRS